MEVCQCHYHDNRHQVQQCLQQAASNNTAAANNTAANTGSGTDQQQQQQQHGVDTILYQLLHSHQWEEAAERCREHPEEAAVWILETTPGGNICARLLPLHYACLLHHHHHAAAAAHLDLVRALIGAYSKALSIKDHSGRLPLHCACWRGAHPDVIRALLGNSDGDGNSDDGNGNACSEEDHHGRLPLHVACEFGADVELVRVLVRALPDAIFVRDHLDRTPLAVTAYSYFYNKHEVMQVLEGGFWSASKSFENDGNDGNDNDGLVSGEDAAAAAAVIASPSPSLFTLICHKQWEKVDARVNVHVHVNVISNNSNSSTNSSSEGEEVRQWVEKRDSNKALIWKLLPLHRLCEMQPHIEVVRTIVHAYPKDLTLPDHHGRLPLHSACRKGASHDIIDLLVQVEPRTAMCKDKKERLPLHIAVEYNALKLVIEVLLRVAAGGAEISDKRGRNKRN